MKKRGDKGSSSSGFTLIELLVVTTLLSVISISVFSVFSQSLTLWGKARNDTFDLSSKIFIEKLTRDLTNAVYLSNIPFIGTAQSLSFAVTGDSSAVRKGKFGLQPYQMQYLYQAKAARLVKREKDYIAILNHEKKNKSSKKTEEVTVLEKIKDLQFRFYERDALPGERWSKVWNQACLPHAVQVQFNYRGSRRNEMMLIDLPQGGCP